jgi:type II secretory pathway pseudopilin PulG
MKRNSDGFTLIELVISFALLSAGIMAVTLTYADIVQLQTKDATERNVQQSSRYVLDNFARDVRAAAIVTLNGSSSISLETSEDAGLQTVTYAMAGATPATEQLYRCVNTVTCNAASGQPAGGSGTRVQTATFALLPATAATNVKQVVEVNLVVQQLNAALTGTLSNSAYSYTINSVVTPRGQ